MLPGLICLANEICVGKSVLGTPSEGRRTAVSMISRSMSRHANANGDVVIQGGRLDVTVRAIVQVSLVLRP